MTRPQFIYLASTTVGFLLLIILFFVEPGKLAYDVCFSRRVLHFYCAGCGATRATHALLHGEILTAFRYNPVYTVLTPLFAYLWLALGLRTFNVKRMNLPIPGFRWFAVLLALLVVYSLLRNLPFELFQVLRPE